MPVPSPPMNGEAAGPGASPARGPGRGLVIASVAVAALLLLLLLTGTALAHPSSFADVSATGNEHEAVEFLAAAGVIEGYQDGNFRPREPVTRAQGAKILVGQRGVPLPEDGSSSFTDLDALYRPYVMAAAGAGFVAGYPDGTFRPYRPLQRQHMAIMVVRSLGLANEAEGLSSAAVSGILSRYADRKDITAAAAPYVAIATTHGLMKGDTAGNFLPTATTVRAHFAMVAYRAEEAGLAVVEGVRYSPDHPDKTRVVLDLSRAPSGLAQRVENGALILDISGSLVEGGGITLGMTSPEVNKITVTQAGYRPPKTRAVITLDSYSTYKAYLIPPSDGLGNRLVVDVYRRLEIDGAPLVAVDPGHGGSDPGATGTTGVKEKDVNLAIALKVNGYLRQAGMTTLMTRTGDTYPTLEERVDMANAAQADIFLSIHNNASGDSGTSGTETFYWGDQEDYSVEGMRLAQAIQEAVCEELGSADRGARTHWKSLYVLGHTDMPAALVEVGFLTNPEEEVNLLDPAYQDRAAKAIVRGIIAYFEWDYVLK